MSEQIIRVIKRLSPAAYAGVLLSAAILSHFVVLSNDSFPLLWQAEHLSIHDPASFYNGFFPIGYPLLLRIAAITQAPLITLETVQVVLAALYVVWLARLIRRYVPWLGSTLIVVIVLFNPELIRTVLSATPDFLASLFALLAFYAIARSSYGLAGIAFGMGTLVRSHMLALVIATAVAIIIFERQDRVVALLRIGAGVLPFILIQGFIQIWSGHGFFESEQAFNVYRTMYPLDWSEPPHQNINIFTLIASDPSRFLTGYVAALWPSIAYLVPLLLLLLFYRRHKQVSVLALSSLLYILIITVGFSPRALIPVCPVVLLSIGLLARQAFNWGVMSKVILKIKPVLPIILLLGVIALTLLMFAAARRSGERQEEYKRVAQLLSIHSTWDAKKVYCDNFGFYFPNLNDVTPRTSGGWAEIGLPRYLSENPHISTASPAIFHDGLVQAHIHAVIFDTPPVDQVHRRVVADTAQFIFFARTPAHEIYLVR